MNREEYDKLKNSGMLWEIYPDFTGYFFEDLRILKQQTENKDEIENNEQPI